MNRSTYEKTLKLCGSLLVGAAILVPSSAAAASSPAVSTGAVSSKTYSSAAVSAYVNPRGQPTSYFFQYGTTGAYGTESAIGPAGSGTATIKVTQSIAGLQAATTYHYRVVATNPSGTTRGSDRTFTTPKIPLSLQIIGTPNPVVFSDPFTVEGNLTGTGNANRKVVLQANPFPYTAGFKDLGNVELTNATGGFAFPVLGLTENAQLRVMTLGDPVISSPTLTEGVAVRVVAHSKRTRRHGFVKIYGTVAPAEVGALVGFQLLVPHHNSVNEGGTVVTTGTPTVAQFSKVVRLHHFGVYRVLIKTADGAHVSAYSNPILVR
jgi:hypothetical protein